MFTQKSIVKKTMLVAGSTLLSRFFGIIRDMLLIRYLGATGLSDIFITAFKIPNSLRKIFAEGALSATFTPTAVEILKTKNRNAITGLMSLAFIFFESMVLILCAFIMYYADSVLRFIAPGFSDQQIIEAIPLLHILMPFIFFISSSALLGGALHAVGHFFTQAITQVILNIIFIGGLCVSMIFNLPINYLCWVIVLSGLVHFILHLTIYLKFNFNFSIPSHHDFKIFKPIINKFFLCLPSVSMMEIANFIDTSYASLLPAGSLSLISYANRFIGIPLGVFAVAFSTILLPHFSRINTYSPKRLPFYLLESAKLIFWVTIPAAFLMSFFSHDIFYTLFFSKKFTLAQVNEAGNILTVFTIGLFFFSLNKILLNLFYSIHAAWVTAIVSLSATGINILFNQLLIGQLKTLGLAGATTISGIFQTIFFLIILQKKYNFKLYIARFFQFTFYYLIQLTCFGIMFIFCYWSIISALHHMPEQYILLFSKSVGLWLWVGPFTLLFAFLTWYTRAFFKVQLYFLP